MALISLDCMGMTCPQPVMKIAVKAPSLSPGDQLEVKANCSSFASDVKKWCERMGKVLIFCKDDEGGATIAKIQF